MDVGDGLGIDMPTLPGQHIHLFGLIKLDGDGAIHLLPRLGGNILLNGLGADIASGGGKIGTRPHTRHLSKVWEFLAQYPRGIALEAKGYLVDSQVWHSIYKKMNMVWVYLQSYHLYTKLGSFLPKKLTKAALDLIHQHFSSTPRNPDKMIVDQRDRVPIMSIFLSHRHILACLEKGVKGADSSPR